VPDNVNFSNQIHDFNPGIQNFPSGLFWVLPSTAAISVDSNLGLGRASYRGANVALGDYGSIPNSLSNGPFVPATVNFDLEWSGIAKRGSVSNSNLRFALDFVQTGATITWSAVTSTASLHSTGVTSVNFAEIAHETNGVFFS
jgi:hypothetical protein